MGREQVEACIDACNANARECRAFCEKYGSDSRMLICVINCRDCAELCEICMGGLRRGVRVAAALCRACAAACELCITSFRMDEDDQYKLCINACRHCAAECRKLAG